jgi:hypothetical protein
MPNEKIDSLYKHLINDDAAQVARNLAPYSDDQLTGMVEALAKGESFPPAWYDNPSMLLRIFATQAIHQEMHRRYEVAVLDGRE